MGGRPNDYSHLIRIAALFAAGLLVFLTGRSFFVPKDFGVYGHYRAGALDDARARPVTFAGQAACVECHSDIGDLRKTSRHATVSCEACHGPLATHAAGDEPLEPVRPDGVKTCVGCHLQSRSKPPAFPQINVADHAGDNRCVECHNPHAPKIS
jgi:cytochrome c7-like protein